MLPKEFRLTSGDDFRTASRKGRRAGSTTLVVHLWVGDHTVTEPARVGFVVSKAVGNAVIRNRVRRRLRHLVRELLQQLPDSGVLVVRALPASADVSSARLSADLTHCLDRVLA